MRTFFITLLILVSGLCTRAASTNLVGTLTSVNGTVSSGSVAVGTFQSPPNVFLIQNGGVTATNAMTVFYQLSTDNTNFITVASFNPPITNAAINSVSPVYNSTIYLRVQVVTTNAVNVGIIQTQ